MFSALAIAVIGFLAWWDSYTHKEWMALIGCTSLPFLMLFSVLDGKAEIPWLQFALTNALCMAAGFYCGRRNCKRQSIAREGL